jgi:hypothetical protein
VILFTVRNFERGFLADELYIAVHEFERDLAEQPFALGFREHFWQSV